MKKCSVLVALMMVCCVLFTGCGAKVTAEDFKSAMTSRGLTASAVSASYESCTEAYEASSKYVTFRYYSFSFSNTAASCYSSIRMNLAINDADSINEDYISGGQTLTQEIGSVYNRVIQQSNTVLYISGRNKDKAEIDKLIAELGLE